jgi:hypothetical protein
MRTFPSFPEHLALFRKRLRLLAHKLALELEQLFWLF